jgi:hypothetical protein
MSPRTIAVPVSILVVGVPASLTGNEGTDEEADDPGDE